MRFRFLMHLEIYATMLRLYLNPESAESVPAERGITLLNILVLDRSIIPFAQIDPVTGPQIPFPGHSPFHSIRTMIR